MSADQPRSAGGAAARGAAERHSAAARAKRRLTGDPTADIAIHRVDDRFIPIRALELADAIAADPARFGEAAPQSGAILEALQDVIAQEAVAFDRRLVTAYLPFNPDRETIPVDDQQKLRTDENYLQLLQRITYLLGKANFVRMSGGEIEGAIREARWQGVRIRLRPELVRHVSVWVRGITTRQRSRRTWRRPWRGEQRTVPVYRRLALVFRLPDDPYVYLKLFKEIPLDEVEALLPHAEVQMTLLDRLKLVGGGATVAGSTATKVLSMISAVIQWTKLLWVLLFAGIIIAFRAITGYRTTRMKRDWQRTRHLYYQNLDNNVGVIHTLLAMIAQEDVKEALLVYLTCHAAREPVRDAQDLARRIECYLHERFHARVNFDLHDAVQTVTRLGLWIDAARFTVVAPAAAIERLRAHWNERRTVDLHEERACGATPRAAADRLA
ncbi:MAG: DUF3754 domain-containing protein [Phycisphaerae bacterium]